MQHHAGPGQRGTPGNPICERATCRHPLRGARRMGHFAMGSGPCKALGCPCAAFIGQIVRCFQGEAEMRVARVIVLPATRRRA